MLLAIQDRMYERRKEWMNERNTWNLSININTFSFLSVSFFTRIYAIYAARFLCVLRCRIAWHGALYSIFLIHISHVVYADAHRGWYCSFHLVTCFYSANLCSSTPIEVVECYTAILRACACARSFSILSTYPMSNWICETIERMKSMANANTLRKTI